MRRQGSALLPFQDAVWSWINVLKELIAIGIPVSFQECMVPFLSVSPTAITNGFGVYAASAVGIASNLFDILPCFHASVSNALTALTAQIWQLVKERAVSFVRYRICVSMLVPLCSFMGLQLSQSMISLFPGCSSHPCRNPLLRGCSLDYLAVSSCSVYERISEWKWKTVYHAELCGGALVIRVPLLFALMHYRVEVLAVYDWYPLSSTAMFAVIWFYESMRSLIIPYKPK